MSDKLLITGMSGSVVAAICCLTPVLPLVLGAVGLGGVTGFIYRDSVLLPVLGGFVLLTGIALWRRPRT